MNLSEAHRQILELLAAGHSYEQVLASNPKLTFQDLAAAARSALEGIGSGGGGTTYSLEEIRKHYPNAYQPWTAAEEARLLEMLESGGSFKAIADTHGRTQGAIESRVLRLIPLDLIRNEATRARSSQPGSDREGQATASISKSNARIIAEQAERLLSSLDHQELAVLESRTLRRRISDRKPAGEVSRELGITIDHFNRVERTARRNLGRARNREEFRVVRQSGRELRRLMGERCRVAEAPPSVHERKDSLVPNLLLWLAGPYYEEDGWLLLDTHDKGNAPEPSEHAPDDDPTELTNRLDTDVIETIEPEAPTPVRAECIHEIPHGQCSICDSDLPSFVWTSKRANAYHLSRSCEWLHKGKAQAEKAGLTDHPIEQMARTRAESYGRQPCSACFPRS